MMLKTFDIPKWSIHLEEVEEVPSSLFVNTNI